MKTILYVGSGTATNNDNTSLTPSSVAETAIGDLVLISAASRLGTARVSTPEGWTTLGQSESLSLIGRIWRRGDTIPLIAFANGAAGETTMARVHVFRFTNSDEDLVVHGVEIQTNGSAQDISTPALTVTADNCAILNVALKQDDFTGATRAGFTIQSNNPTTDGNDAGTVLLGKIITSPVNEPAGTITVTGGAAALSWAMTIALLPYVTTWTDIATSDRPCDFTEEFNSVSEAACAALSAVDSSLYALRNPPAIRVSAGPSLLTENYIQYTSVDIDPIGQVSLVADPDSVTLTPPGLWMGGHAVNATYTGTEGHSHLFGLNGGAMIKVRDLNSTNNPPSGGGVGVATEMLDSPESGPVRFSTWMTLGGTFPIGGIPAEGVVNARLCVFRISD